MGGEVVHVARDICIVFCQKPTLTEYEVLLYEQAAVFLERSFKLLNLQLERGIKDASSEDSTTPGPG